MSVPPSAPASLVKDSVANVARVFANALFAIAVTPFVLRALPREAYSAWVLVVGLAGYVGLAELGIQGAVIRRVAADRARGVGPQAVLSSSLGALVVAGALASVAVMVVGQKSSWLFLAVPEAWRGEAVSAFRVLGLTSALALPGSALNGYFSAVHRAMVPAVANVVAKVASGLAIVVMVRRGASLPVLAALNGGSSLAITALLVVAAGRELGFRELSPMRMRLDVIREMRADALTFVWWSIALVAITGLDAILVSRVDFSEVGAFGVAAQVVSLVLSTYSAMVIPLLPRLSGAAVRASAATGSPRRPVDGARNLDGQLLRGTNFSTGVLALWTSVLFIGAPSFMRLYGGGAYAVDATRFLRILLAATVVRQAPAVLGLLMVATGEHRRIRIAPLIEGGTNVVGSLVLAHFIGADGVAWGTLVGGVCIIVGHATTTLRHGYGSATARMWIASCFRRPLLVLLPAVPLSLLPQPSLLIGALETAAGLVCGTAVLWRLVFGDADRAVIRALLLGPLRRDVAAAERSSGSERAAAPTPQTS